jgi:hypothetical protein
VPYHNSIGLAVSYDGGKTFSKMFKGPVLSTDKDEPFFCGTAFVMREEKIWRMWYLSCVKWEVINGKPEPFYHIKYAESNDGISWKKEGIIAIDFKSQDEGGIASAAVIKENDMYFMWYCYRKALNYRTDTNASYRIGYAESYEGIKWIRKDDMAGIDLSVEGWDSKMNAYPYVVSYKNKKYMFYNGNDFGKEGFGYAVSK